MKESNRPKKPINFSSFFTLRKRKKKQNKQKERNKKNKENKKINSEKTIRNKEWIKKEIKKEKTNDRRK